VLDTWVFCVNQVTKQGVFDTMGSSATWEYIGKISPAIPTLRKLVDHMEDTVNSYRRYKKHTVPSTETDVTRLMVTFRESALYEHINGRKVKDKEKFVDIWARGFNIVSKGESLARWFENRSELQPARQDRVAKNDGDPTWSELEEMVAEDEDYVINLNGHMWESGSEGVPSP
jgi:hypothetical protein